MHHRILVVAALATAIPGVYNWTAIPPMHLADELPGQMCSLPCFLWFLKGNFGTRLRFPPRA
jgi:hypothetical protein